MTSNNPQIPPQQFDKSSSDQVIDQPDDTNAINAQQQKYVLSRYWDYKHQQIAEAIKDELKKREFSLSRIKKIMMADEDVQMVSSEAPILFAKACEFFIQELTVKSWLVAEHSGRLTIRKNDIVDVITNETNYYDFLFDVVGDGSSSSHADPAGPVVSHADPVGVLVLPPDENEMINEGEQEDDQMNVELKGGEHENEMNVEMNGGEEENQMNVEKNGGEEVNEMDVDGAAN